MLKYKKVAKEEYEALAVQLRNTYSDKSWFIETKPSFDDGGKTVDLIVDRLLYTGDPTVMRSYDGLAVCVILKHRPGSDTAMKMLPAIAVTA